MKPVTSGFALAAAVAILFNTALAWVKDAYPRLNQLMQSLTGHHWTTHGIADLIVFVALGCIFTSTRAAERISADRLIVTLTGAVAAASLGLVLWFAFV